MIRRSTGQLCLDLSPSNPKEHFKRVYYWQPIHTSMIPMPQLGPVPESIILSSFTLEEFHDCVRTSGSWESKWFCNIYTSVQLGSIVSWLDSKETMCHMESKFEYTDYGWTFNLGGSDVPQPVVTESGWSRIASWSLDGSLSRILFTTPFNLAIWLAQANHIFSTLQITSNQGTYCFVEGIQYSIHFPGTLDGIPRGYLFLCPLENLQTADETQFQHPDLPAYWSLDPSGIEKLSTEEAENLGFPPLEFTMEVHGIPWPEIAYSALRQFHQAKGFDPKSQDVARHLGYPLYQISPKWETRFAYVEEFVDPELPGSSSPRDLEIDEIEIMLQDIDFDETTLQTPDTSNHMNQSTEPAIITAHMNQSTEPATIIAVAVERAQCLESWLDNDSLLAFIELLEKDPGAAEVYVVIEREAVRVKWVRRKLEMM
ncbi:hypothetical protein B0H10DRAFT_1998053 [Mycena sp. CBHHK59/15]|nr:hypothetical protein B0H10DRAFT_1998053 [Mycena sp. CBHHK59/15]